MQRVAQREAHAQALDGGEVRRHVAQEQRARGHRREVERAQRTGRRCHARQVLARHVRVVADERERTHRPPGEQRRRGVCAAAELR